jgi:hypothetical protein
MRGQDVVIAGLESPEIASTSIEDVEGVEEVN